jgi:hypothetical protein
VNRDTIKAKCEAEGVRFVYHSASWKMRVAGWYHRLRGDPLFSLRTYVSFYPDIYVPNDVYSPFDDWQILDHELVHWERQRDRGVWSWVLRYLVSWKFREQEEKPAFVRSIKNGRLTIAQVIKRLRGPLYGVETSEADLRTWFVRQLAVEIPRVARD